MQRESEVWRGAMTAAPQKGLQTGTAMTASGEGNPPGTPPTTGEVVTENETAETEVRKRAFD